MNEKEIETEINVCETEDCEDEAQVVVWEGKILESRSLAVCRACAEWYERHGWTID